DPGPRSVGRPRAGASVRRPVGGVSAATPIRIGDLGCPGTWCAPFFGLCTYCATPGRGDRPLDALGDDAGTCFACGDEREPVRCVPGQPCEEAHGPCGRCGLPGDTCDACHDQGAAAGGCVFCHGTGRTLPDHRCTGQCTRCGQPMDSAARANP